MRILITGSTGFLAQHVILELRDQELFMPNRNELDLLCGEAYDNLGDYVHKNKIDTIIHLGAFCGGIGRNRKHPGRMIYENLQMGLNVLDIARIYNCRLINLGSVCMYPKHTPVPFQEKDIWNGYPEATNAPYGIAKRAIVEAGIAYNDEFDTEVINLIPVNLAGEFEHFDLENSHVIPAMVRKFVEASEHQLNVVLWGDGSPTREFLYAGDCAKAIAAALKWKNPDPYPINIGSGQEVSMRDLAYKIRDMVGGNIDIRWDTSRPNGQPRRCLDVTKAKEKLGFVATTSLDEILRKTIEFYRRNRKCEKRS